MVNIVRLIVAGVLLAAAGMKFSSAAVESRIFFGNANERWLEMALVQAELFLGLWLLSGLWRRAAWGAATACFGVFAAVSFYKAVTGQTDCGCLGRLAVNPWYMASFDMLMVGLLTYFWPVATPSSSNSSYEKGSRNTRLVVWIAAWLALAGKSVYWMWPNVEEIPVENTLSSPADVDDDL